jgi:hypothetical protein
MVLLLLVVVYFIFKIVRINSPSLDYKYQYTRRFLTFFGVYFQGELILSSRLVAIVFCSYLCRYHFVLPKLWKWIKGASVGYSISQDGSTRAVSSYASSWSRSNWGHFDCRRCDCDDG